MPSSSLGSRGKLVSGTLTTVKDSFLPSFNSVTLYTACTQDIGADQGVLLNMTYLSVAKCAKNGAAQSSYVYLRGSCLHAYMCNCPSQFSPSRLLICCSLASLSNSLSVPLIGSQLASDSVFSVVS